jgi:alkyl sulfatase BDS1-like metallo-beta-lactamase superfamily hydrolase
MHSVDRVLGLEPETLINGHEVFRGAEIVRTTLTKVRDATAYLRNRTIDGMNQGRTLWDLMSEVTLPADLALPEMHGKVPWIVRAIWEEHTGWFRYESTTELYHEPATTVWTDIVDLAGLEALTRRARHHADAGRPLRALHLTDVVLSCAPGDEAALQVKRDASVQLLEASGHENFSEVQWLQSEIFEIDDQLGRHPA